MTRWRTYLILAWKLTPKRVVIQIIRTMVAKAAKVTRTVNIFRNPLPQRATGEERRAEMRIRKAKSPLAVNREEVIALAKVKAPVQVMRCLKIKARKTTWQPGKKKPKALTQKDLDDLRSKLEAKRPMCWNYVSEKLGKQYIVKHYETHGELMQEILNDRYNKLRDLVHHMFSHYIQLISEIANDFKKDRKAHLTMHWMTSFNTYLDRWSNNSKVCSAVFQDLAKEYSWSMIRAVTGILHSFVYDFAQTESYNFPQPLQIQQDITPEDDVALFRMSGAALCQNIMIKLRKDTLSEKKGKRNTTTHSQSQIESELEFLVKLKETDKSHLPDPLKILDEGHLTLVKKDFLNFVREADLNI